MGLGSASLVDGTLYCMYPFPALVSTMKDEEVLAIADPKDRELVRFSVGEILDANVTVLKAGVPRPQ